jgi:hypothetical protein
VPHRVQFWNVKNAKPTWQFDLNGGFPFSLDVSPDGAALAVVTSDEGVSLRVFDLDR